MWMLPCVIKLQLITRCDVVLMFMVFMLFKLLSLNTIYVESIICMYIIVVLKIVRFSVVGIENCLFLHLI